VWTRWKIITSVTSTTHNEITKQQNEVTKNPLFELVHNTHSATQARNSHHQPPYFPSLTQFQPVHHSVFTSTMLFVLFCVLFVCKRVLYYCHRVSTQLQLTNVSYHIVSYYWKQLNSVSTASCVYDMVYDIRYDMIWYMIWYDMIWYTIRYDIWYDMMYDMILYDIIYDTIYDKICDIWYDMMWYDMIWYDMIYDMIWYDVIWYDMWYMIWYWYIC
jgi:hypothetical protein